MSPGPSPARSRIEAALPSPSTCPSSAGSRGPGLAGPGPGKSRKHRSRAAPLLLKIAPGRGCHAFRRPRGTERGGGPGYVAASPSGTGWGRGRAARSVGRPACGSPSGSLGSPGGAQRRDDGELLEFPAAGERDRPGEPAQRGSGRGRRAGRTLARVSAAPVVWEVSPPRSRTSPGRGGRLPSPAAPSGLAGVQARPSRAWAADRGQVQATPLPQPPGFPLGPSPPPESEALRPPGEGAGAQAQPPGRPGSLRGGGGKTRERIPSAGRPAPPARAEASKGFSAGGRRGGSLPDPPPLSPPEPVDRGRLGTSWMSSPTPAAACFGA